MTTKKLPLPFEITPQIKRYLEDIFYLYNEWYQKAPLYLITVKTNSEEMTPKQSRNAKGFWGFLEKQNSIQAFYNPTTEEIEKASIKGLHLAIARIHDDQKRPVKFYGIKDKNVLKKVVQMSKRPTSNIGDFFVLKLLNIKTIKALLNYIKEDEKIEKLDVDLPDLIKASRSSKSSEQDQQIFTSKIKFDPQNGRIMYKNEMVKFHRGPRGEAPRLLLFKKLWPDKKCFKNGTVKTKGRLSPPEMLAVQLGVAGDSFSFSGNKNAQEKFRGYIKGINRALREKNIPAKIEQNNGVQLVITEK